MPRRAGGFTLLEMLVVCIIAGIALGVAAPRMRGLADSFAVDGAAREVTSTFARARLIALRDRGAEVRIDSAGISLFAGGQRLLLKRLAADHSVRIRSTVPLVKYAATGAAMGLSNGSIYISRGKAADTVVISRLGRVRR